MGVYRKLKYYIKTTYRVIRKQLENLSFFIGGFLVSGAFSGLFESLVKWNTLSTSEKMLILLFSAISVSTIVIVRDSYNHNQMIQARFQNTPYRLQVNMYRDIAKIIDEQGAREAVLIQYSGSAATNLLYTLAYKGANITMYIENSGKAISQMQAERIKMAIGSLPGFLQIASGYKLKVYEYDVPASIRAVKIDENLIAIGWYTYEHMLKTDKNYPNDHSEISGHDIAGFLLYKGSPEFEIFNEMLINQIRNYEIYTRANNKEPILELPQY